MILKNFNKNITPQALSKAHEIANTPAFKSTSIRLMPNASIDKNKHLTGLSICNLKDINPSLLGTDIGDGILVIQLQQGTKLNFEELSDVVETYIRIGALQLSCGYEKSNELIERLRCKDTIKTESATDGKWYYRSQKELIQGSAGILGQRGHFIEIDKDSQNNLYLIIHAGSCHLGEHVYQTYVKMAYKTMAEHHKRLKKELIEKLKAEHRYNEINVALEQFRIEHPINKPILYEEYAKDFLHDVEICQQFAKFTRQQIATEIMSRLNLNAVTMFDAIHNGIDIVNNQITLRKGAIPANKGQQVLIPLNLAEGCIIGIGKGNPDWNFSAPNGLELIMSRKDARKLSMKKYEKMTKHVYGFYLNCATLDTSPMVYRDSSSIIDTITDTVEITEILKPIYSRKAD